MKILSIGYYDDFARFYLKMKKEFKKENKNIEFKYLSLYFSGYLYFLFRLQNVSFFSFKVWINKILNKKKYMQILDNYKEYKGVNLDSIIKYHLQLDGKEEINLKLQAISYIDIIENLLNRYNPDILILSGDSRMSIEILNLKAKELDIKTYYFEQGPFGTTVFDEQGVNANASIRNIDIKIDKSNEDMEKDVSKFYNRKRTKKYKRNPIYRGSDYILQFLFSKIGLLPIDIKMEKEVKATSKKYINLSKNIYKKDKKVFLLILQVPYDANMVYHSPFYKNHFEIVKDIYNNLPTNSQLLVREHPLFKSKYEKELYDFMYQKEISLDIDNLYNSIEKADVVIVNNSTVGIEAISKLKPVIVLGNSYYDNDKICLKLKDKKYLKLLLQKGTKYKVDTKNVLQFLDYFLNKYLIDGHFRDNNLISPKIIVKNLLKQRREYV
jgi:capsular polysaccharide export protein